MMAISALISQDLACFLIKLSNMNVSSRTMGNRISPL
jgi:hypothetical protein